MLCLWMPRLGVIANASFAADAMRLYLLPSGKINHHISITCTGNDAGTVNFQYYVYEVYTEMLPTPNVAIANWVNAGSKCLDALIVATVRATSQAQIVIQSQADYLLFVIGTVTAKPTTAGQCNVCSW